MMPPVQQELLQTLAQLCDLSPDARFGQLLDHLGLLSEDQSGRSLAVVEDQELLEVMKHHRTELARRQQHVA
jgi:hypothetical protein